MEVISMLMVLTALVLLAVIMVLTATTVQSKSDVTGDVQSLSSRLAEGEALTRVVTTNNICWNSRGGVISSDDGTSSGRGTINNGCTNSLGGISSYCHHHCNYHHQWRYYQFWCN